MARFCMYAFRRHGRVLFADTLANLKLVGSEDIERQLDSGLEHFANLLPNATVTDETIGGENMEQMMQELSPTYERLENAAER